MTRLPTLTAILLTACLSLPAAAADTCTDIKTETACHTLTGDDCALLIVHMIDSAQQSVSLQFYNFTEERVWNAALAAAKRGVKVRAVFDKISPTQKNEGVEPLYEAGVPVWIDYLPKIAHNKIAVVDGHLVSGGSFNPSANADHNNAENVTITDSQCLASSFDQYITSRISQSRPYTGGGK